jgi:hypothetical protein
VAHTIRTPSTNVPPAANAWSASAAARTATSSAARWGRVAAAPTATTRSCWPSSSEGR